MSSNNHVDPCCNKSIKPNEYENKNYESMTMQEILEGVDPNDSETLMKIREGMINRFLERERVLLEEQLLNDRLKTNLAKREAEIADYMAQQPAENKIEAPEDNKNKVDVPKNNKNKKDATKVEENKKDAPRTMVTRQMCQQTRKTKEMSKAQKIRQDHQNLKKPKKK